MFIINFLIRFRYKKYGTRCVGNQNKRLITLGIFVPITQLQSVSKVGRVNQSQLYNRSISHIYLRRECHYIAQNKENQSTLIDLLLCALLKRTILIYNMYISVIDVFSIIRFISVFCCSCVFMYLVYNTLLKIDLKHCLYSLLAFSVIYNNNNIKYYMCCQCYKRFNKTLFIYKL